MSRNGILVIKLQYRPVFSRVCTNLWEAVEAVVEALLAVALSIAHTVVKQLVATHSSVDRRAVLVRSHLVGTLEGIETTLVRVAFHLETSTYVRK